ncbi:MAG TPA: thiamine pyrophosphate-binding protein [Burkholderiales bacterium]|nr:thiamine pyrophosphate-binding protein [Burkholderiales bacterium]
MKNELKSRTGGQLLVDALKVHGADTAFCVPGESFLAVLDALYDARDAIKLIVCRQEGGAANMAEAYGKLTGKPGVCIVTRGPGATNASIGVHTAFQDSTPMILLIGQVASDCVEREAFQEVDYRRMYGQMAKWVASIDRVERVPEYLSHAYHCAMSGRKGPVVLALPEDMLTQTAAAADTDPYQEVAAHPGAGDIARLRAMLAAAERPLVVLGGSGWNAKACADLRQFVEANGLPAGCAFRFQDLFDNTHANYAGDVGVGINPKLAQRVKDADVLLAIGARLGEATTSGYTLLSVPRPAQKLVHVHAGAEELGRVYQGDLLINSGMQQIATALAGLAPIENPRWRCWTQSARADYLEWTARRATPGRLQLWDVVDHLNKRLPADAILTNGAGNASVWLHRFYRHRAFRTQLAPTSGAMGYGVPAAIAAKIVQPQRTVVSWSGDGCFLMCGQELATAAQYGAKVIFIVVNNGMYGTIRMHQEREYPARVYGTALANPDFALLAHAYGAHGELVEETSEFAAAFERALDATEVAGKPALIELRIDPQAITPNTTLDALREQALKRA